MANQKLSELTNKSTLDGTELVMIVDDPSGTPTSKRTTAQAIAALVGYKEYVAMLRQTGTSAPTVTVLKNTLSGTPVWTRVTTGQYRATLAAAFPNPKTVCIPGSLPSGDSVFAQRINDNTIEVYTTSGGVASDELLGEFDGNSYTPLIIRVYP